MMLDSPGEAPTRAAVLTALDADPRLVGLLDPSPTRPFYLSMPWWRSLAEAALNRDETLRIYAAEMRDGLRGALLTRARAKRRQGVRALRALATVYSVEYGIVGDGEEVNSRVIPVLADALAAERPRWDIIDLGPFERTATCFERLALELRRVGFWVQPYFQFGMWYERIAGRDFATFLAMRSGALRTTLKRAPKRLEHLGHVEIESVRGGGDLAAAIMDYEGVHARSWKPREPYPEFMPRLMREASAVGALRLGILRLNDRPIAAQVWIVWNRRATIFKLTHDERFKRVSPGSVLTMHMMRRAIEDDQVEEIDFGRGDDPYKRSWLGHRRQFWGVLACNPRTACGLGALVRHGGSAAAMRGIRRLAGKLGVPRRP